MKLPQLPRYEPLENISFLLQVRDNDTVRLYHLLLSSNRGDCGVLGGLLQLSPEPAHLRLLQPRIPSRVQEDFTILLSVRDEIETGREILREESRQRLRDEQQRILRRPHEQPAVKGQ